MAYVDCSKTRSGGLLSFRHPRKVMQAGEMCDCPQRCHVHLYELYNSFCLSDRPADAFYLPSLEKPTDKQWFSVVPVGVNTLFTLKQVIDLVAPFISAV